MVELDTEPQALEEPEDFDAMSDYELVQADAQIGAPSIDRVTACLPLLRNEGQCQETQQTFSENKTGKES